jgi:hypothetical protein
VTFEWLNPLAVADAMAFCSIYIEKRTNLFCKKVNKLANGIKLHAKIHLRINFSICKEKS